MMLHVEAVQLQDQRPVLHQLLIVAAAVSPAAAEQALIPPAAGFDIRDADERLGPHGGTLTEFRYFDFGFRFGRAGQPSCSV